MRRRILWAAALAAIGAAPQPVWAHGRATDVQATLADRLTRFAARIARDRKSGILSPGQADFMTADLTRIWSDATRVIDSEGAIGPAERASYTAMLRRIEARLDAAEATRPHPRPITRRSVRE
ncbi:hypothetical protein M9979_14780 [Sphingomonas sp. RP10(2022)]|uniref:Uncharacterized protein n=1 Tax=Sphingomonas liriopis TaxID=2949094 RepID=A0A9X2KUM5_9SPHN|nr:hypothetical protein [Sphingomonas liriopis]MCP3736138.1 hypothetical protein [Sphingomonas liriopis]